MQYTLVVLKELINRYLDIIKKNDFLLHWTLLNTNLNFPDTVIKQLVAEFPNRQRVLILLIEIIIILTIRVKLIDTPKITHFLVGKRH